MKKVNQVQTTPKRSINRVQILIGVVWLLIGSVVYLIDRPPNQTYFVYSSRVKISLYETLPNVFGAIGNSLPDFLHVFSFILITAGLVSCQKRGYVIICLSWFSFDLSFELGQKYNELPLKIIPNWFKGIPFLENTENYFSRGTFDILDVTAIALGTVIAYFVLLNTNNRKEISWRKKWVYQKSTLPLHSRCYCTWIDNNCWNWRWWRW